MLKARARRVVAGVLGLGLLSATLTAQQPVSHETVQVTQASATGLASTTVNPAGVGQVSTCVFSVENGPVRAWADGTDPTSTTGHWFAAGAQVTMTSYQVAKQFRVIAVTAASTLQTTCVRGGSGPPTTAPFIVSYDPGPIGGACNALQRAAGICK